MFSGAASSEPKSTFTLEVALRVAQSSPKMYSWLNVANSTVRVFVPPQDKYWMPKEIKADDAFRVVAGSALGRQESQPCTRNMLDAIVDMLHGIPPWWLLQFHFRKVKYSRLSKIGCSLKCTVFFCPRAQRSCKGLGIGNFGRT